MCYRRRLTIPLSCPYSGSHFRITKPLNLAASVSEVPVNQCSKPFLVKMRVVTVDGKMVAEIVTFSSTLRTSCGCVGLLFAQSTQK